MPVGFVGLGNMGSALASNLVGAGFEVVAYDAAGPDRVPAGATAADGLAAVAARCGVVVLSLPNGDITTKVAAELTGGGVTQVVDTSTVGVAAARDMAATLAEAGIGCVDAPVSGGVDGARARTLVVMYAGTDADCEAVRPVIEGLSDRRWRVGDTPGAGQALKLANNFLSATALAATSEAVAYCLGAGLSMDVVLEVLDSSSGRNSATADKFPNHVLTGRYASGFANSLMDKDVRLYLSDAARQGLPTDVSEVVAGVWERFAAAEPGVDFTRIFPFVAGPPEISTT